MHMGFIRMSGRTLDAVDRIPKMLWGHLGAQLGIDPPEMGTLRSLYIDRIRTLSEHRQLAYRTLSVNHEPEPTKGIPWRGMTSIRGRTG